MAAAAFVLVSGEHLNMVANAPISCSCRPTAAVNSTGAGKLATNTLALISKTAQAAAVNIDAHSKALPSI